MSEYDSAVERQRILLEAEAWADSPKSILIHQTTSMWYETEKTKKDAVKGVVDVQYMDGRIERTVTSTGKKYLIQEGMTGADLVQEVVRNLADSGKALD